MKKRSSLPARATAALGIVVWLALPAIAQMQQPVGVVDAVIGGDAYHGETLDVPTEGTSTAEFRSYGPMTSITIQAHDPDAASIMRNVLVIEISLLGANASAPVIDVSVSYWPEGMSAPFFISDDSGVDAQVTFEALSLEDEASATGSFSAVMCRQESLFVEADTGDCLPVEGTFDTGLRRAE